MTNLQLAVSFPTSSEDHRLQLVDVNGSIFAILFAPLTSDGPIELDCPEWSLVLMAPIESKSDISIKAINVIVLGELKSSGGSVSLSASNRLVLHAAAIEAAEETRLLGAVGQHQLAEESGISLNFPLLFQKMISQVRQDPSKPPPEAQKRMISSLCTLAEQLDRGTSKAVDMRRVLRIWNIATSS